MAILSASQSAHISDTQGWVPPAPPATPARPAQPAAQGNRHGIAAMAFGDLNSSVPTHLPHLQHSLLKLQEKQQARDFLDQMMVAADAFERTAQEAGDAYELTGHFSTDITPPREKNGVVSVLKDVNGVPPGVRRAIARRIENAPFPALHPGERPASLDAYLGGMIKSGNFQGETMLMALDYFDRIQSKLSENKSELTNKQPAPAIDGLSARDTFLQKLTLSCVMLAHKYHLDDVEFGKRNWSTVSDYAAGDDNDAMRMQRSKAVSPAEIGTLQSQAWALLDHQCEVSPASFKRQIAALQADLEG